MQIRPLDGITASMWRDRILYGTLAVAGLVGVLALDAFLSREAAGAGGVKGLVRHGAVTTALVVDCPTALAPVLVCRPRRHPTAAIMTPNAKALKIPPRISLRDAEVVI